MLLLHSIAPPSFTQADLDDPDLYKLSEMILRPGAVRPFSADITQATMSLGGNIKCRPIYSSLW